MNGQQSSSLVSILVIVGIIALLAALLVPLLKKIAATKADSRFYIAAVGAACGIVGFIACNKLMHAVGFALGWYSFYPLRHIGFEEIAIGAVFGSVWALKRTPALKAMLWQGVILTAIWLLMLAVQVALFGYDSLNSPVKLLHNFVTVITISASSGFVTAWTIPHVLTWLSRVSAPPAPLPPSGSQREVEYRI